MQNHAQKKAEAQKMPWPCCESFGGENPAPRRLFAYSGSFLRKGRIKRILELAGYKICFGVPKSGDGVVVWGHSPVAWRGEKIAQYFGASVMRVEDAFLRSVLPGRAARRLAWNELIAGEWRGFLSKLLRRGSNGSELPLGIMMDQEGVYFDSGSPSRLERILKEHIFDEAILLRARRGMARMVALEMSKYNNHHLDMVLPEAGYVLVVDQTYGDASIRYANANENSFSQMLQAALDENPHAQIVVKTHPETILNLRNGHFQTAHGHENRHKDHLRVVFYHNAASPHQLLARAKKVYTVSSLMGFEAILHGHRPQVFGTPFYAGWGLSDDRNTPPAVLQRRGRKLDRVHLFAAAMLIAPTWYDPCRDRLCSFEDVLDQLEAEMRVFREDFCGYIAYGMSFWKHKWLQRFFGRYKPLIFAKTASEAVKLSRKHARRILAWSSKLALGNEVGAADTFKRVEDGFIRSNGLGAELVAPLCVISDDVGIYYDPSKASRLEYLIPSTRRADEIDRARSLRKALLEKRLTKYNLGEPGNKTPLPDFILQSTNKRILVGGQVEDDASIIKGAGHICQNLELLKYARLQNPQADIIYKPHPDVEAGLRLGKIHNDEMRKYATWVAHKADPVSLIEACDEVWVMTSLIGFEALLRDKKVVCLGAPFYAGWGLTTDVLPPDALHGPIAAAFERRALMSSRGLPDKKVDMDHLVYAALIAYPRYIDPVSNLPCPPEVAIERLYNKQTPKPISLIRGLRPLIARLSIWWR